MMPTALYMALLMITIHVCLKERMAEGIEIKIELPGSIPSAF